MIEKLLSLFFFHTIHRDFGQNEKFLMTLSCQMNGRCVSALMQSVSLPLLPQTVLREFSDKLAKLGTPTTPVYSRQWIQISPGSTFCDFSEDLYSEYISYQELTEAEQPWIGGAVRHFPF
jgi:hypothetical protein